MNRLQASALVLVLWAVIYLPGLGSTEIVGEEGRRILPAVTMLETGNWLVPYVSGKPFLRKPPLVNWAIAASFRLTGVRDEWTARLPSALCVLALGLTIVGTSGPGWLSPGTALIAAIFSMTQFGLMAKARFAGAEIEGLYAPLSGMAVACWLAGWARGLSPWRTWLIPGALLGVACLAKGPSLHLLFFYAIVLAVLWRLGEWRWLRHPAHAVALVLAAGIFAAWAVPYLRAPEAKEAAKVWKEQGIERFTEGTFSAVSYLTNPLRALGDQLPWILFAPVALAAFSRPRPRAGEEGMERLARGMQATAYACAGCFVLVLAIPGTLPRYALPLGVPVALVLAWALTEASAGARARVGWHRGNGVVAVIVLLAAILAPFAAGAAGAVELAAAFQHFDFGAAVRTALVSTLVCGACVLVIVRRGEGSPPTLLAVQSGVLIGAAMLLYATAVVPWINRKSATRAMARAIDGSVPGGKSLVIFDAGYVPAIFYLRTPHFYADRHGAISTDAEWVLVRGKERKRFAAKRPEFAVVQAIAGKGGDEFLLLQRRGEIQKLPAR